jgi:hypothetical protein
MNDIAGYRVTWSHTSRVDRFEAYDEAVAAVRSVFPAATIGHDGDISGGGESTLCWPDEVASLDDDGARAVAAIWVQHRDRRADILSTLAGLDDGTGTLGVIVDQALADDPAITAAKVREIVCEAIADARADAAL